MNPWMVVLIGATALAPIFSALVTLAGALLFLTWLATSRSFSLRDYSAYTKDNRQYSAVGLLSLTLLIYFTTLCILVLIQGTSNNDIAAIFAFSQFFYLALMLPFLAKKNATLIAESNWQNCHSSHSTHFCTGIYRLLFGQPNAMGLHSQHFRI